MTGTGAEAFVDLAKSFTKFQSPFVPVFFVAGGLAKLSGKFWWEFHGNGTPFLFLFFIYIYDDTRGKRSKMRRKRACRRIFDLGPRPKHE